MSGHIIVCGMGQVGYRIVNLLCRLGESVTVVTQPTRADWVREAAARRVTVHIGDARDPALLSAAGIETARVVIAATDHDPVNLEIALDVRLIRPDLPVVVRLFDDRLAPQLESALDVRSVLSMAALAAPSFAAAALGDRVAGAFRLGDIPFLIGSLTVDHASPLAGQTVGDLARTRGLAILALEHAGTGPILLPDEDTPLVTGDEVMVVTPTRRWDLVEREVHATWQEVAQPRSSPLARLLRPILAVGVLGDVWHRSRPPLRWAFLVLSALIIFSVVVLASAMDLSLIDALYFVISTVTTTGYGDITAAGRSDGLKLYVIFMMLLSLVTIATLYSIITDFIVTARFEQLLGHDRVPEENHVVVIGLGNVGYHVVEELRLHHARVAAVDHDGNSDLVEAVRAHTPVVIGDGRLPETLAKAGVASARAVIALTQDDSTNLGITLAARQLNPRLRIVARLLDADFARKVQHVVTTDTVVMSSSMIGAPKFVASALYPDVLHALEYQGTFLALVHRTIDEKWENARPSQIRGDDGVMILMRRHSSGAEFSPAIDDAPFFHGEEVLAVVSQPLVQ